MTNRLTTIDILRALTMVLMIFVNDLWSLTGIPLWLEHVERGVDGLGLADVVFPAFLFIVGLSIPYAIENRRKKGDTQAQILQHVIARSIALLVMGVFLVNGETINEQATGMHRLVWNSACCACFILIWNKYPTHINTGLVNFLKVVAIITLVIFAFIYRGGEGAERFQPQWWGILGLIGWAYLAAAVIAVFAKGSLVVNLAAWIFFSALSIVWHAGLLPTVLHTIPAAISGGTLTALVIGGVCVSMIVRHYRSLNQHRILLFILAGIAVFLIALSMLTRPYFGISKLGATPAWLFLCSAFTVIGFIVIYLVADLGGKANWFGFIRPAGTDTLLCYLIPYFAYAFTGLAGIHLPEVLFVGAVGLVKSFTFALLCVLITYLLTRAGVRLKL
jgi:heparan-alpha-glucosaminide N-acetyltransferase